MFDFSYQTQAHQANCEERIQRALRKAERIRYTGVDTPQPSLYRQALSQVGGALIAIGTRLQPDGASAASYRNRLRKA